MVAAARRQDETAGSSSIANVRARRERAGAFAEFDAELAASASAPQGWVQLEPGSQLDTTDGSAAWGAWSRGGPRACDVRLWARRDRCVDGASDPWLRALAVALARARADETTWCLRGGSVQLSRQRPWLVGIVNVTPDSFSDGGRFSEVESAVAHALGLARAGCAMLDVGGESTRPGSESVPASEQLRRVLPVVEALVAEGLRVCVDTTSSAVAERALVAGAQAINDTSAGEDDPSMASVIREHGAGWILMHRLAAPRTMQQEPTYEHCVAEVCGALAEAIGRAECAGVDPEQLAVDPGIGFGKRTVDNLALIRELYSLRALGRPRMLGASRKSVLGRLTGRDTHEREAATLATTALAFQEGVEMIRVHDVAGSYDVLTVLEAVRDG